MLVLLAAVAVAVPNLGFCQNSQQSLPVPPMTSNEEVKNLVRKKLQADYKPDQFGFAGPYEIRRIKNVFTEMQSNPAPTGNSSQRPKDVFQDLENQPSKKSGGTWTGGGGTGVACLPSGAANFFFQEKWIDQFGSLKSTTIPYVNVLEMVDFTYAKKQAVIPALKDESPIQYIERIANLHFSERMPLFARTLVSLSRAVDRQLQQQLKEYAQNPVHRPQLTLRDFGDQDNFYLGHVECRYVQLATRYARIDLHRIQEFFIDFDIALILRMRKLAASPQEAVVQEASLILHEALYLYGSAFEQMNSSLTTFGAVPFLLHQSTVDEVRGLSRGKAALWLKQNLFKFQMHLYQIVEIPSLDLTSDEQGPLPLSSMRGVTNLFQTADEAFVVRLSRLTDGIKFTEAQLNDTREQYATNGFGKSMMRKSLTWTEAFLDALAAKKDDQFSFLFFATLIKTAGDNVIDDLFIRTPYSDKAQAAFCQEIQHRRQEYAPEGKTYKSMEKAYNQALRFCSQK